MLSGEIPGRAAWLIIGDQIDAALTPQMHILAAVRGDMGKSHCLKHRLKLALFRCTEFNKFKAIKASRVFKQIGHFGSYMRIKLVSFVTIYAESVILSKPEGLSHKS
jgi:hypothetical protein